MLKNQIAFLLSKVCMNIYCYFQVVIRIGTFQDAFVNVHITVKTNTVTHSMVPARRDVQIHVPSLRTVSVRFSVSVL